MKKIFIYTLVLSALFNCAAFAGVCDSLDVFEEFAVAEADISCSEFFIETTKNTPVSGMLKFSAEGDIAAEIVTKPKKGTVDLKATTGEFVYTPYENQTGTDSFQFRIRKGEESSNIAYCNVTINETQQEEQPEAGFIYEDMRTHWANYSAVKLVEEDVVKGERIGNRYYFHPETKMRRIDVIEYMLSALKADFGTVDKNETHIFEDSAELPEYINYAAYLANKIGFVSGVREGDKVYLRPYEYINRAEIIKMIDTAMGGKTMSEGGVRFTDEAIIPDWAAQSVKNLSGYGIIKGYDDGALRPYDNITKAQTAEMLYQMIKYNRQNAQRTMAMRIKNEFYGKIVA